MADKLLAAFCTYLAAERRLSPRTVEAYTHDLHGFIAFMQNHIGEAMTATQLAAIKARDMTAYLASLHEQDLEKTTINRALSSVRNFFTFLDKRHGIKNTAVRTTRGLRQGSNRPAAISGDRTAQLIEAMVPKQNSSWAAWRDYALLLTLYGMGLRISEALSLKVGDLGTDTLTVTGKGNKQRRVPLLKPVRWALEQAATRSPQVTATTVEQPLFVGSRGDTLGPRYVQRLVATLRQQLELPDNFTPHALRHCFASHLLTHGADLRVVQELLGHASLSTTQRYLSQDTQRLLQVHTAAHPLER